MRLYRPALLSVRGVTLLEIIFVTAILAVLVALLFPALKDAQAHSQSARCMGNLKQISVASAAYSSDHSGYWPKNNVSGTNPDGTPRGANIFATALIPYLFGEEGPPRRPSAAFWRSPLVCPADRFPRTTTSGVYRGVYSIGGSSGYGLSYAQRSTLNSEARASIENPSRVAAYFDMENHYIGNSFTMTQGNPQSSDRLLNLKLRHHGRIHAAFADGSVRTFDIDMIVGDDADPELDFW